MNLWVDDIVQTVGQGWMRRRTHERQGNDCKLHKVYNFSFCDICWIFYNIRNDMGMRWITY